MAGQRRGAVVAGVALLAVVVGIVATVVILRKPVLGGYAVVTEFDGTPKLVVRTVALELLTFETVTEEHTRFEELEARPLQGWRDIHWAYFTRFLAPYGMKPEKNMPVVMERFEIVCR